MDRDIIRLLTAIAEARGEFLSNETVRAIDYSARGNLLSRYL